MRNLGPHTLPRIALSHALARKAQEATRTPACRDASEHGESSRPEVRGFSGVSSPQPHRSSDHQSRAAGRWGGVEGPRGVAPHWTRPDSRAVNLRYVQSERQSDRASSRRHAFGRIVMFINLVSHKFCGSSFAIGKRVGLSVHCCGRAPGREVRDCDAMACSC